MRALPGHCSIIFPSVRPTKAFAPRSWACITVWRLGCGTRVVELSQSAQRTFKYISGPRRFVAAVFCIVDMFISQAKKMAAGQFAQIGNLVGYSILKVSSDISCSIPQELR